MPGGGARFAGPAGISQVTNLLRFCARRPFSVHRLATRVAARTPGTTGLGHCPSPTSIVTGVSARHSDTPWATVDQHDNDERQWRGMAGEGQAEQQRGTATATAGPSNRPSQLTMTVAGFA
jgi:hypothetical protein